MALLVYDEAFQLVGLESPVEDKPTCFFIAGLSESNEGMVVESVKRLTNHFELHLGFVRYLNICDLVNPCKDLNYSNGVLAE